MPKLTRFYCLEICQLLRLAYHLKLSCHRNNVSNHIRTFICFISFEATIKSYNVLVAPQSLLCFLKLRNQHNGKFNSHISGVTMKQRNVSYNMQIHFSLWQPALRIVNKNIHTNTFTIKRMSETLRAAS